MKHPCSERSVGASAGQGHDFDRSRPPGWVPLRDLATALGLTKRALRNRCKIGTIPKEGCRKVNDTWFIDPRFVPGGKLKLSMAKHPQPESPHNPTEWDTRSVERDATIRRIVADADKHAARQRGQGVGLTVADKVFCTDRGDGYYSLKFKPRTLRNWRSILKRGGACPEKRGRKRGSDAGRIGADAWNFFVATVLKLWLTVADAYAITGAESARHGDADAWQWSACVNTVRRRYDAEVAPFFRDYYRKGSDKWRAEYLPKLDRRQIDLPGNYCWELDGTKANVLCRHGRRTVRPTVVLAICPATRLVVGAAVGLSESTELIRRACWRGYERFGAPKLVRCDGGKAFLGEGVADHRARSRDQEVVGLLQAMGCEVHKTTGRSGWEKGSVERAMRIIDEKSDRLFGRAYVGNNPKNRNREADAFAKAHFDKLPTLADYERVLIEAFEADARTARRDFDGLSPLQRFEQTAIEERRLPKHAEEFIRRRPQRVKVGNRGVAIRIAGEAHYFGARDARVWERQGQRFVAYIDDGDLSNVLLCETDGKPLFYVNNDGLIGMDAETLREAGKAKKRAAKLRREYMAQYDLAVAPTADVAVKLRREAAEAESAKVAAKLTKRERGSVTIIHQHGEALKNVQGRRVLRVAAGAEGMTDAPDSLVSAMGGIEPVPQDVTRFDITDLDFSADGQEDQCDAFEGLL